MQAPTDVLPRSREYDALAAARKVTDISSFQSWARNELKSVLPHGAMMVCLGLAYKAGLVPRHSIFVDVGCQYFENIKNAVGGVESPVLARWFDTQQPQFFEDGNYHPFGVPDIWLDNFREHGLKNILVHGNIDVATRRFALVKICNIPPTKLVSHIELFKATLPAIEAAAWRTIDNRNRAPYERLNRVPLTDGERTIISFVAKGFCNKEIAKEIGISESTVKTYLTRVFAKLDVKRRPEAVARAQQVMPNLHLALTPPATSES